MERLDFLVEMLARCRTHVVCKRRDVHFFAVSNGPLEMYRLFELMGCHLRQQRRNRNVQFCDFFNLVSDSPKLRSREGSKPEQKGNADDE